MTDLRIGFGFDVHRLEAGRKCVLGGVKIPSEFGPLGHSDADVLLHAICDALLGALNLRDIGHHFSDTDPQFKNIDSRILIQRVMDLIAERNYAVVNIDCTVVTEKPKLNPHVPAMQEVIAGLLRTSSDRISIKATTHELVDSFGEGRAIKAYATVLLSR